jgi:TolB protein
VVRLADGSFLAATYTGVAKDQVKPTGSVEGPAFEHDWPKDVGRTTPYFLKGSPDGRTWTYLSQIPNHHVFSFTEPALAVMDDGRIVCLIRTDWLGHLKDRWPEHVGGNGMSRDGYGWFMFQSESTNGGRTWSEPVQLPIWGHPPYMLKLASGNVLLVYGHRRPPWSVRAILSRDGGRTWDLSTLKTLRTFKPGNLDLGYPVATQLPDGRIFCAYYGYSSPNVDLYVPHGIFATIFSEQWLAEPSADSTSNAPTTSREAASMTATQPAGASQPQLGTIVFSYITYSSGEYHKGATSQGSIYSVRSDGTGLTKVIDLGCANNPKVPPDGQWLYFQSDKTGNWHIYRCHLDGSGLEDLTADEKLGKDSFGFDLSPDGRKIVFTSAHNGVSRVATMNPDGSDQRLLASELGYCYMASFSPDGRRIVFAHTAEDYRLKLANLDGSNMISLTPDLKECFAPQFTPDGQWIYFIRRDGDIYRVSPDATRLERLTQGNGYVELHMNAEDEHGSTDAPRISPNGRRIAFCGMDKGLSQVRVMNIDGTGLRQLTTLPDRCGRVRWSLDSRRISFISFVRDSQPQLFAVDADGGQPRRITNLPGAVYLMEWVP